MTQKTTLSQLTEMLFRNQMLIKRSKVRDKSGSGSVVYDRGRAFLELVTHHALM